MDSKGKSQQIVEESNQPVINSAPNSASIAIDDSDHDGVANNADQCNDSAPDAIVDIRGCPLDTDADGIIDNADSCRGTPRGVKVDQRGCGYDDDNDGIANYRDDCKQSPAKVVVNAGGCEVDTDNDGIVDSKDQCAGTPPGVEVEPMGCLVSDIVILQGANFKTGSAALTPGTRSILIGVATTLKNHPKMRVEIGGHTDNTGTSAVNKNLSLSRARSARHFLVKQGVDTHILAVKGYADAKPLRSNDTSEGRLLNRRVEIRIVEID